MFDCFRNVPFKRCSLFKLLFQYVVTAPHSAWMDFLIPQLCRLFLLDNFTVNPALFEPNFIKIYCSLRSKGLKFTFTMKVLLFLLKVANMFTSCTHGNKALMRSGSVYLPKLTFFKS